MSVLSHRFLAASLAAASLLAMGQSPAARAAEANRVFYRTTWGDRTLTWSSTDLIVSERGRKAPVSSFRQDFFTTFTPDMVCERQSDLEVLSVVGPFVSVYETDTGNCVGTAHPYAVQFYKGYDLRAPKLGTTLDQIFPPASILHALLGDRLIQTALAAHPGARPTSLPGLITAASGYISNDCSWGIDDDLLTRFAFHHLEGNQVAVRLGLSHGCEANRGHLTQIGILLPVPATWKSAFEAATQGKQGFLMLKAPKGETDLSHKDPTYPD